MRLLPANLHHLLLSGRRRPFCSLPPKLKNLCYRHRARALREAQRALTDYLHSTRALPFAHADHIATNSPFSLSALVAQIPFPADIPPADIPRALRRFLRYRPVNEFDFFFESIGLPLSDPDAPTARSLPLFLADDAPLLAAVSTLAHFGFPWTRLGLLYRENPAVFGAASDALVARLSAFEALGLRRVCVISVCLAFPSVLTGDYRPGGDIDLLFRDLKRVFVDYDFASNASEDNVDLLFQICRRIRVFYDLGAEKGEMGELMARNRSIFLNLEESLLAQKLKFFIGLGMKKDEVGPFLLKHPEILNLDLRKPSIAMPEYLKHIGLDENEVVSLSRKYPYVMGKNRLENLPGLMRALNIHEQFRGKLVDGNIHYLYPAVISYDRKMQDEFLEELEKVKSVKKNEFIDTKVEFLLGIGFGENKITSRAAGLINGTREQLQERFNCLLVMGVEYPMLCRMISAAPKLLNQSTDMLQEKVHCLCNDLGYSLGYLDNFPAFLCFNLENRIKPRYKFLNWLKGKGLLRKHFSPATVLANSEKRFIVNLLNIHPAAPKQWLEIFSSRNDSNGNKRVLFLPHPCSSKSQGCDRH